MVGHEIWRETLKTFKMRNTHYRTWSMARNLKIMKNGKHTVGHELCKETLNNLKNKKCTLLDLAYGIKTEKSGKSDTHTVVIEIWQDTLKEVENEKCTL
jgi:hypothetical protein